MRRILLLITVVSIFAFMSCGEGTSNQPATVDGFSNIENEIKSEFGDDAYFTDLTITYNKSVGNIIGVTVTEAPETLKMGQWNLVQDSWKQNQDITIEVPQGSKASDFMFQLNDNISIKKLGSLVEKSCKQLTDEKYIENPAFHLASIKFPRNGDVSKTEYLVILEPENGGTSFRYNYKLNGELIKMDY